MSVSMRICCASGSASSGWAQGASAFTAAAAAPRGLGNWVTFPTLCASALEMIMLSHETEVLARRLADAHRTSVDAAVRRALEAEARAVGVPFEPRRMRDASAEAIARRRAGIARIVGEIASMPVLDRRSPGAIMDALNDL